MAGDWIKMRGALIRAPKLIRMTRELQGSEEFRQWLTPGGGGAVNGQIVSDEALRCVTVALLGVTWSYAREHGKWMGDDLLLPYITLDELDEIAGVDGFGAAMQCVHWAKEAEDENGVIFPNFQEFNVPMTAAEKQREYRKRRKGGNGTRNATVTDASNAQQSNVTTREEKRREESNTHTHTAQAEPAWREEWERWVESWEGRCGKRFDQIQADIQLQQLHDRPPDKAKRDLQFSLEKYSRTILDSDHDFQKRGQSSGGKPQRKKLNL